MSCGLKVIIDFSLVVLNKKSYDFLCSLLSCIMKVEAYLLEMRKELRSLFFVSKFTRQ